MSFRPGPPPLPFRGRGRDRSPIRSRSISPTNYSPKPRSRCYPNDRDDSSGYSPRSRSRSRNRRAEDYSISSSCYSPRSRSNSRRRESVKRHDSEDDAERYFEHHRKCEWFCKQFHPIQLRERRIKKQQIIQNAYAKFMSNIIVPNYGDQQMVPEDPFDGRRVMITSDQNMTTERMKNDAPFSNELEKVVISDARYRKSTIGFLVYNSRDAAQRSKQRQSETERSLLASIRSKEPQLRFAPKDFSENDRLEKDCVQLQQLISLMDKLNGVVGQNLQSHKMWDNWSLRERVDVQIAYLRKVHSVCYYCLIEYEDEEELCRRCTLHYRESPDPLRESKLPPKTVHWFKNFDSYERSFYNSLRDEDKAFANDAQKHIINSLFDNGICKICGKRTEELVNHALNAHISKVNPTDLTEINDKFKRNFMNDPKKKHFPIIKRKD